MATPGSRLPISPDDEPPLRLGARAVPAQENPWRVLRRLQDRHRYLRLLETDEAELDLDVPPARADHHLLGAPASMTRTATNHPEPARMADYLSHSADLTLRGGLTAALTSPLAACALAEHYVFRRIGGTSAAAVTAAAVAAAELGRTAAPDTDRQSDEPDVQPGFAGLAELVGWLTAQDCVTDPGPQRLSGPPPPWPEQHRLARLVQPARTTRNVYRVLVAAWRSPSRSGLRGRWWPLVAGLLAAPTRPARLATGLVWAGAGLAWLGLTLAFVRATALGAAVSRPAAVLASLALLATFTVAAAAATAVAYLAGLRTLLADHAEAEHYGLVPGVELPDLAVPTRGLAARLDRLAGVPRPDGVPALVAWLADRLDDLAGVPPMAQGGALASELAGDGADGDTTGGGTARGHRPALTFGELWLGRLGPPSAADRTRLRRAAEDPQLRTVDLVLKATDAAQQRPYSLPFVTAEQAERSGASRFLFCRNCLTAVLPVRVVTQMILTSPAQATESTCPRHDGEVLREIPDPWDFPVVAAVRLSMSVPGLLRAVPLYTLDVESPAPVQDTYGRVVGDRPAPTSVYVPRVQWFADGGLTGGMPVHTFDTLLPRWPTFALALDHLPNAPIEEGDLRLAEWISLPEQDAAPRARGWRRLRGVSGFVGGLLDSATTWNDAMQADLPGFRGRVAMVRHGAREASAGLFLDQPALLALALRGHEAGVRLRERFTGPDGDIAGQTQTDRYRWLRLRMALREYRGLSLDIGARLPMYTDLAATYRVPQALTDWFAPPLLPGTVDPAWPDAAATLTHLRALSAGGVLDWDTDYGAPPVQTDLRILPDGG